MPRHADAAGRTDIPSLDRACAWRAAPLTALLLTATTFAQDASESTTQIAPPEKGVLLSDVERSEFRSRFTGHEYHIWVCLPPGYREGDEAQRYPVLFVPDAEFNFLAAKAAKDTMDLAREAGMRPVVEEFVLVGVPLKVANLDEWGQHRTTDLTPTASADDDARLEAAFGSEVQSGGGARFLQTLQQEVIPFVEQHYRVTDDRGIAGFSLGGLFVSWLWLTDDRTFSRFLIGSPSLWWDREVLLRDAAAAASKGKQLRGRVFASVGADEGKRMVDPLQRLADVVKAGDHPELRFEHHVFDDESHMSATPTTFSRGIRTLYRVPEEKGR